MNEWCPWHEPRTFLPGMKDKVCNPCSDKLWNDFKAKRLQKQVDGGVEQILTKKGVIYERTDAKSSPERRTIPNKI